MQAAPSEMKWIPGGAARPAQMIDRGVGDIGVRCIVRT
jgi:hypothetical protein